MPDNLTLAEAVKSGRLQEFIAQEEAIGRGPIDKAKFDALTKALILKSAMNPKKRVRRLRVERETEPGGN